MKLLAVTSCLLLSSDLFAFTPNSVEDELASLLVNHPNQRRAELIFDPILSEVARSRAEDMAARDYFAHTNPDGLGPNRLVQLAGYGLPDFWGTNNTTNYIESIVAGRPNANSAFSYLLNSAEHRQHVLAEVDFYAQQTHYGIGYANDPGSRYVHYYVIITAPPNLTPSPETDPFAQWKSEHGIHDDLDLHSDSDEDGIELAIEFVLNLDPTSASQLPAPTLNQASRRLEWTLPLREDLGGLAVTVCQSSTLRNWTAHGVQRSGNTFSVPVSDQHGFLKLIVQ